MNGLALFDNIDVRMMCYDREELKQAALDALNPIYQALDNDELFPSLLLSAARIVTADHDYISPEVQDFIAEIFSEVVTNDIQDVMLAFEQPWDDKELELIGPVLMLGQEAAEAFLTFILAFAYCDGEFSSYTKEQLRDACRNAILIPDLTAVRRPAGPSLTAFESEILSWFRAHDQLWSATQLAAYFPGHSRTEVKAALESLLQKGLLCGGEKFFGGGYGLA